MFTSCVDIDISFDDYQYDKVSSGTFDVDYCNFMWHDQGEIDSTCEAICKKGDFYSLDS